MQPLISLIIKDLKIELRAKELLISLFTLSILLAVIFSLGLQGAFVTDKIMLRLYPVALWVSFLFAATISISRSFEYEFEDGAQDGLIQLGVSPSSIFFSKFISNSIIVTLNGFILETMLCIFLDIKPRLLFPTIIIPTILVSSAYCALATLFAALTQYGRMKTLLLPLLLLPLLFPIYFAALESTYDIIFSRWSFNSSWTTLLFSLNIVYVLAGVLLFEYVVKE